MMILLVNKERHDFLKMLEVSIEFVGGKNHFYQILEDFEIKKKAKKRHFS